MVSVSQRHQNHHCTCYVRNESSSGRQIASAKLLYFLAFPHPNFLSSGDCRHSLLKCIVSLSNFILISLIEKKSNLLGFVML